MLRTVVNIFKIADLRNKVLFTVGLLLIYRVGFHIAIPGFDMGAIATAAGARDAESPFGRAAEMMQIFTGGNLDNSSLFGLGIMPYITASIILMLLQEVVPALKKLRHGGADRLQKDTGVYAVSDGAYLRASVADVYAAFGRLHLSGDAYAGGDNGHL